MGTRLPGLGKNGFFGGVADQVSAIGQSATRSGMSLGKKEVRQVSPDGMWATKRYDMMDMDMDMDMDI